MMSDDDGVDAVSIGNNLMGHFPLTESELDRLLGLYQKYNDQSKTLQGHDEDWEEAIPELPLIFQASMDTVFVAGCPEDDERAKFLEASVSLCGRRGERFLIEALFAAARQGRTSALASLVYRLVRACCVISSNGNSGEDDHRGDRRSSLSVGAVEQTPQSWTDMFSAIGGGKPKDAISRPEWRDFAHQCLPTVHQTLSTVFQKYLFGPVCTCRPPAFQLPEPEESLGSLLWTNVSENVPTQLALLDLGGKWRRIFCSELDGLSFRTFHEALMGFSGPTLILIQTVKGEKLGYFTDIPWKSSPNWFTGEGDSFLFRLHPGWSVYHPIETGLPKKYHQLLNTPVSHRNDNLVGFAVGGVASDHPRLHITESLERCRACSIGTVFNSGPLLTNDEDHYFDVDVLEVWSVRTDDATFLKCARAGKLQTDIKETRRQNSGTVDRTQFVDDFASGVVPNSLFAHRDQARGRAEFVAADDEGSGYFVQGKEPSVRHVKKSEDDNS